MPDRNTRITLGAPGLATVEINGQDVSRAIRGLTLNSQTGHRHQLTLDLVVEADEIDGQAQVHIPADTAALLVDLGWSPPDDGQPVDLTDPRRHDQIIKIIKVEARRDPAWFRTLLRREERVQRQARPW